MAQKKGLGRGLNDLLGTSEASKPSRSRNNQQNSSENTSKEVKTVTKEVAAACSDETPGDFRLQ